LNTFLPCLHSFLDNNTPTILTLQETKLTAKKFPKYLQRMFSQYKLLFNNTNTNTKYNHQPGVPYIPPTGGLLTFIHNKYAYPNNITKIPTNPAFSPCLQIIKIQNFPLNSILLLYLYMPSYHNDLHLIPSIMQTITQQITHHPNAHIILCGDFNRDIALIGHTEDLITHPSQ
jgi:exonuclease III